MATLNRLRALGAHLAPAAGVDVTELHESLGQHNGPLPAHENHRWCGERHSDRTEQLRSPTELIQRQIVPAFYPLVRAMLEEDGSDPAQYNPNGLHQGLPERYADDGDSPLPIGPDTTRVDVPAELSGLVDMVERAPFERITPLLVEKIQSGTDPRDMVTAAM